MKYLLNKALIIFSLSLLPFMANAQTWIKVTETPEIELYIDKSSIKKNGSIVTYWTMHNKKMATLLAEPSSNSYSAKFKVAQNCETEEFRIMYFVSYEKFMGEGKVLESQTFDRKPEPNIPGSINYTIMKYVCNSNRNSK